jgi:protein O-GlcNAc transferase
MTDAINPSLLVADAQNALESGDRERAESLLRTAATSGDAVANAMLAWLLHRKGALDDAEMFARRAIAIDPGDGQTAARLGAILMDKGAVLEAIGYFQSASLAMPESAELHNDLGNALAAVERTEEAEAALRKALSLNAELAPIHNNLGNILKQTGKPDEAIAAYRAALNLEPAYAEAENNLAIVLQTLGDIQGAIGHYRHAIELSPGFAAAYTHMGTALAADGRLQEAIMAHKTAIDLAPKLADAHNNLAIVLKDRGEFVESADAYRKAIELKPTDAGVYSNLLFCLCGDLNQDEESLYIAHRGWAEQFEDNNSHWETGIGDLDLDPERHLRIGYLSSDFNNHSVAYFLEGVLANHDHQHFHITCYADGSTDDDMTMRLRKAADDWRPISGITDAVLSRQIREDRIDVLIDLAGHTADNRLAFFSQRAAPVQVTWIGYPATTGLSEMDYRLTDQRADPVGESDRWHSERLLRLPDSFLCYTPPPDCPEVAVDSPAGHVTFGSFNNLSKVTRPVIELWAQILRSLPTSQLLLKARQLADETVRDALVASFGKLGIAPERLQFHSRIQSRREHLDLYSEIDIALDTFPYCGATTTCEALWMGVPVVTLAGTRHASRVGASLLTAANLSNWIATSEAEYVAIATALAESRPSRKTIRQNMGQSALTDAPKFTKAYEQALRGIWQHRCESAGV